MKFQVVTEEHSTRSEAEVARYGESIGKDRRSLCGRRTRVTSTWKADLDFIWVKWRLLLRLIWS